MLTPMFVEDLPPWLIRGVAFVFGALWGSFFNVAISRWPREMSVVSPPSHCPSCGAPVVWYRNVPILAYLLMRGRASCCGAKLTSRYVLVELIAAVLCLAVAERFLVQAPAGTAVGPAAAATLACFFFLGGLVVATFTDLEWMMIPDEVTLPGAALGLATISIRDVDPTTAALGAGLGYLVVQVVFVWIYERVSGRRGMGEGDAKLLLFIGAFVGWKGALFSIVGGAMQGVVAAVVLMATRRPLVPMEHPALPAGVPLNRGLELGEARCEDVEGEPAATVEPSEDIEDEADEDEEEEASGPAKLPFGPFLALAALEWFFFGEALLDWYLGFFPEW